MSYDQKKQLQQQLRNITNTPAIHKKQTMKNIVLILLMAFAVQTVTFGQQSVKTSDGKEVLLYEDGTWKYAGGVPNKKINAGKIKNLEIPNIKADENIISHTGYSLSYNETHEQANWVAYELTKEETKKLFDRTDKFMIDPLVKSGSANDNDYSKSGYDRGHLAPAADMGWSSATMAESFYYSNMSPQDPGFNRGIWKKLEELVRSWAIENDNIYIVTSPVLTNGLATIGTNQVSVPEYYYKVILDYSEPDIKGIGFILKNTGSQSPLQSFAVTIDSVERYTGIDFFPLLPHDQEKTIKNTLCLKCWNWNGMKPGIDNNNDN